MPKVRAKVDVMYSIRITRELDDELCRVAEAEGRTKTNVIRHYLELGLRVAGKTEQVSFRPAVYNPEHYPELDSVLQNVGGIPA
jgi:predicted DNA-binding protein